MTIFGRLLEEFLKAVPVWIKVLVGLELGTYFFFAFFFFPTRGQETFRSVLTDFRWQVTAVAEFSAIVAAVLLRSARRMLPTKRRWPAAGMGLGALALSLLPIATYLAVRPHPLIPAQVDVFYLDAPDQVSGFRERVLRSLLSEAGNRVAIRFNWPDWSTEPPANFTTLDLTARLSTLARRFGSQNPIGITAGRLGDDLFWQPLLGPGGRLATISVFQWDERFAPPTAEEYLVYTVLLTTLVFRLHEAGAEIPQHRPGDFGVYYFDWLIKKSQIREVICHGRFKPEDEQLIRAALGRQALESYREALSLRWLPKRTCPE